MTCKLLDFVPCLVESANERSSLCKKFTASGRYHQGAIEHFNSLHLQQVAEDSEANDFVKKARALSLIYLEMRTSQT